MATSSSSAMKTSLVLMLLLSAVVASQAHQVTVKNTCDKPLWVDGIILGVNLSMDIDVLGDIWLGVIDGEGVKQYGKYKCPKDVTALEILYVDDCVKVKICEISCILDTVLSLVGTVICVITDVIR